MRISGINSWFSFRLPIIERLKMIKDAGFEATSLWWAEEGSSKQPDMARKIGLEIDNVHAPFHNPDALWYEGIEGDDYRDAVIECINSAYMHCVPTVVVHLTSFGKEAPVTDFGITRVGRIVNAAEIANVNVAFENLNSLAHLQEVFNRYDSPFVGFCYDSGHENWNHRDANVLTMFADRLVALHLNDNFGDGDAHLLPYDGNINWAQTIQMLNSKALRFFSLEVDYERERGENSPYKNMAPEVFLQQAYEKTARLISMYNKPIGGK